MPLYAYKRSIPAQANNPSTDQPDMQTNTNSTDDIFNEDHFSFNQASGGLHKKSRYIAGAAPSGTAAGMGTLYTKAVSGQTQLFYTPDATGNEYRMTATDTATFATFGVYSLNYVAGNNGGWTYLPGGLLLQYGLRFPVSGGTVVTFPRPFGQTWSITLGIVDNNSPANPGRLGIISGSTSTTGFTVLSPSNFPSMYWMAIGSAP